MTRVPLLDATEASANAGAVLRQVNAAFGATPNMFKAVANAPAALASMWGSFGALGKGRLGAQLGELLAVAIAEANRCEYCLAAHTALGKGAGLDAAALSAAQNGQSSDPKAAAAIAFAVKLVKERGQVSDEDVQRVRNAGFDHEQIVEIIAHVALNLYTNYVNIALDVPVDFDLVAFRT